MLYLTLCDWSRKNCTTHLNQSDAKLETNHDLVAHVFPRFGHFAFFFLSSHWLVKVFSSPMIAYVITLLLFLRHSIEKRPKSAEEN